MADQKNFSTDTHLANKMYETSDYQANTQLGRGLAETHEQVSDVYMEGTVDATIENFQGTGKDERISDES